jgi:ureidoglycolate dehydrogenase (NAD+)
MTPTIPVANLHRFCTAALTAVGVGAADAKTTADVLVTTDTWGVFTHGTKSLRGYVKRLRGGGLRAAGKPKVLSDGPAWAIVDGDSALGMVSSVFAMDTAIAKAKKTGIAYVGLRNSCHFGAAGYYAWRAADAGLIGLANANDIPSVTAPGARTAVTGSNPFAYAIPAGKHPPMMLDMAISTVAGGKVYAARTLGKPIPGDWIVGADGKPTTDPSGFPQVGALLPMAGHKGYGIALLIEALSGVLSGAAITWQVGNWMQSDPSLPTRHGASFIAIDIDAMSSQGEFRARMDHLIDELHAAPKSEGSDRIYVPGEIEWGKRAVALQSGIPLPEDVLANLRGLADDLHLDLQTLWA